MVIVARLWARLVFNPWGGILKTKTHTMQIENVGEQLWAILQKNIADQANAWLKGKIKGICEDRSTKDLYLTYSLIGSKVADIQLLEIPAESALKDYLILQKANCRQMARIYLLIRVLEYDHAFFSPKVSNIIQVADTGELETFLKYLILLPQSGDYVTTAVDALRTNISTVFNAIAYHNPYPARFFNEQQWNQMYLKTAFMQGDLSALVDIDKRANSELARIIADYAHERWAASRDIDPYFWRPVTRFLNGDLLNDMKRLLASDNVQENRAGALCCYHADHSAARALLNDHEDLVAQIEHKELSWHTL